MILLKNYSREAVVGFEGYSALRSLLLGAVRDRRVVFLAFRLRESERMRLAGEESEGEFLFLAGAVVFNDSPVPLPSQQWTEGQGLLAFLYVPA